MELGATVCRPRRPDCLLCPLVSVCEARRAGLEERLPRPAARAVQSRHTLVSALVLTPTDDGPGVWLSQRAPHGLLGGLWELPTCEAGEPEALAALGVRIDPLSEVRTIEHAFTHRRWTVRTWRGEGEPTGGGYVAHRVVPLAALRAAGLTGPALKSLHAWRVDGAPVRRGAGRKAARAD
jgi:A/G-specific adenine glycosylase